MVTRFAAVDIGSNTIKITISDYLGDKQFEKVLYRDFPSCLRDNITMGNTFEKEAVSECYLVLNECKKILDENRVEFAQYIATHALREAANQKEILGLIKTNTGIDVRVITGEEEASLSLNAILIDFSSSKSYACINAGGGSTELGFYRPDLLEKEKLYFFRFGAVNLYTEFLKGKSNIEVAIDRIGQLISRKFKEMNISISSEIEELISVGGSIYNAAYIFKKDAGRDFNELLGMRLSIGDIESVINQLKFAGEQEKKEMPGLDQSRIESILPGVLIHYFFLKLLRKGELVISTRTISDGLIYRMAVEKLFLSPDSGRNY